MPEMRNLILVKAAFDEEAVVWFVESSDLPGLNLEAPTLEALRDKTPGAVLDLIEAGGGDTTLDIPIEIVAHASARSGAA